MKNPIIGVLALQGDFAEHSAMLRRLGVEVRQVKLPEDLVGLSGLIIPGGESTTLANLLDVFELRSPLTELIKGGLPVWGTCAGMIMLARLVEDKPQTLGLMNITVARNAFGRQQESFESELIVSGLAGGPLRAVFIRAPVISTVGAGVKILASLENGTPVAAEEKNMLATSFHPELTGDTRLHEYFLNLVKSHSV